MIFDNYRKGSKSWIKTNKKAQKILKDKEMKE